jgi:hypothetical protein
LQTVAVTRTLSMKKLQMVLGILSLLDQNDTPSGVPKRHTKTNQARTLPTVATVLPPAPASPSTTLCLPAPALLPAELIEPPWLYIRRSTNRKNGAAVAQSPSSGGWEFEPLLP